MNKNKLHAVQQGYKSVEKVGDGAPHHHVEECKARKDMDLESNGNIVEGTMPKSAMNACPPCRPLSLHACAFPHIQSKRAKPLGVHVEPDYVYHRRKQHGQEGTNDIVFRNSNQMDRR